MTDKTLSRVIKISFVVLLSVTGCATLKPISAMTDAEIADRIVGTLQAAGVDSSVSFILDKTDKTLSLKTDAINIADVLRDISVELEAQGKKSEADIAWRVAGAWRAAGLPDIILPGNIARAKNVLMLVKKNLN